MFLPGIIFPILNIFFYNISRENTINGQEYKKSLMKCFDECKVDVKLNTMASIAHSIPAAPPPTIIKLYSFIISPPEIQQL